MSMQELSLGKICDQGGGIVRTGPFGSQLHESDYSDSGTPVVMPKDIIEGKVSEKSIARVGQEHVDRLIQHRLLPGDIVYGRRGDIGRQALIRDRESGWLCGTGCLRITLGKGQVDPKWLHYYLRDQGVIAFIAQQAIGATMPNLNTSILRNIPIRFPERSTQRRIASILSAYDDLIENNSRRIAILEEMARKIYEEWFVHFRFPGCEQVKMVESELGLIPEGWSVRSFTDFATVLSGGTPKKSEPEFWGGMIPFYTPKDCPVTAYAFETESHVTELGLKKCNSKLYLKDTVFITARGSVGKVALASCNMAMNQSCYALCGKKENTQLFLYHLTKAASEEFKAKSHGAVFDTIIVETFRLHRVALPDYTLILQFEKTARPMFNMIFNLQKKNANLRATRDLLLPKLISGELDVSSLPEPEEVITA